MGFRVSPLSIRGVAELAIALSLGERSPVFESQQPEKKIIINIVINLLYYVRALRNEKG
jgi:hypothetical protein